MASAAFHFDAQASLVKKSIAASGTTTATLDSTVGVDTVLWTVISTDDDSAPADWTVATPTATSTVVTGPSGRAKACRLQCKINNGQVLDPRTGLLVDGDTIKTAKIYIAPEVVCVDERLESDSSDGWTGVVNDAIRTAGSGDGSMYSSGDTFTFDGPGSGVTLKSAAGEVLNVEGGTTGTVVIKSNGRTVATCSSASGTECKIAGGQTNFTLSAPSSGKIILEANSLSIAEVSNPSGSIAQIASAQQVFYVMNAQSSGQIITRCSASGGFAGYDTDTFGMRSRDGNYDYIYILNKSTGLPSAGDAQSFHGYLFPDISGGVPNGQLRWYGKQKVWQEITCQDTANTATSKRILDRMARLTSSTAAIKDVLTIASADLPSGDYSARLTVDWGVYSVTEAAAAGGCLMATIERSGGVVSVLTAPADQIIGVQDNTTASIDTTTDTPRIVQSSGAIIVRIEVTNTDDVRLWARVRDFIVIEH